MIPYFIIDGRMLIFSVLELRWKEKSTSEWYRSIERSLVIMCCRSISISGGG